MFLTKYQLILLYKLVEFVPERSCLTCRRQKNEKNSNHVTQIKFFFFCFSFLPSITRLCILLPPFLFRFL